MPGLKSSTTVELAPMLDLRAAKPLADRLLALRGSSVKLDASRVEKLGAQCVQVMISATRTWEADGSDIEVVQASPAFLAAMRVMGLSNDNLSTGN
jgi:chemotaxis protein CheX